eukprot:TRINITY_DN828_c0_g1_i1.p1 TRINITY_DN828_c0_g1~~TRINITY_DN828_c0_g1_i1.p1  ORF type:complete len:1026 (+),score=350.52 TRINITY_DN828_c0_g1_i1:132-3209(+)
MSINTFVNDQLHSILGFADNTTVEFIVSLVKRAKSVDSLVSSLQEYLPKDKAAQIYNFAEQAYNKIPRASTGISAMKERERQLAELAKKNQSYNLIAMDVEDTPVVKKESTEDKDKKKKFRKRKASEIEEEEETGESAYERDQREKKEFEQRLLKKEEEQTRKLAQSKIDVKEYEETQKRKQIAALEDEAKKKELLIKLRQTSRESYTKDRVDRQIELYKRNLADIEQLFEGVNLTDAERRELELMRKKLRIAIEAKDAMSDVVYDGYMIPQDEYDDKGKLDRDRNMKKLTARYDRTKEDEAHMNVEQKEWEETQIKTALAPAAGARERPADPKEKKYDLVFDDQIAFIQEEIMAGEDPEAMEMDESEQMKKMSLDLQGQRKMLPIYPYRDELLYAIDRFQVLIIIGETGSGKTTQITQYLHEHGYSKRGKIGCTQPRRVAAMSVAKRVADEMGVRLGHEVGYSIRFEDCTSEKTIIKYMTDGMLLREFLTEPDLKSYSVLIIDEAHERTLHTDVLFGLVKDVARFRPDLKLIISSATLDAKKFSEYFDGARRFKIPGRRYPVDIYYTKAPEADYLEASIVTTLQIHVTQPDGDILVFLTGQEEVDTASEILTMRTRGLGTKIKELIVCRIYSTLPSDLQAKIFEPTPPGARKVILSTNIAETSLTIDGIKYVIDTGFCKQKTYNPRTGMESLIVVPVSKASAQQRAGRAGRTSPGKCFRLYTAYAYQHELEDMTVPEIQRSNLGNVVLLLKSLGINDLIHFEFMDPPPAETLIRALEQLYALGALNDKGELTKLGRRMAEFPLDPMLSKMLLASEKYACSEEIVVICSMLGVNNTIFYRPKDKAVHADHARQNFNDPGGDHMTLLKVFKQWEETQFSTQWCFENFIQHRSMKRARDIKEQLEGLLERVEIEKKSTSDVDAIRKAVASGFFFHTAKLGKGGQYRTIKHNESVQIHPSSSMSQQLPRWVIYHELVYTTKEYMRQVMEIRPDWLLEIAPHYYRSKELEDDSQKKLAKKTGKSAQKFT